MKWDCTDTTAKVEFFNEPTCLTAAHSNFQVVYGQCIFFNLGEIVYMKFHKDIPDPPTALNVSDRYGEFYNTDYGDASFKAVITGFAHLFARFTN